MEYMESEEIKLVHSMTYWASRYGKVRKVEAGIYNGTLDVEITMLEIAGEVEDIHKLHAVLKDIPIEQGYKVREIVTYDMTIQFTITEAK